MWFLASRIHLRKELNVFKFPQYIFTCLNNLRDIKRGYFRISEEDDIISDTDVAKEYGNVRENRIWDVFINDLDQP